MSTYEVVSSKTVVTSEAAFRTMEEAQAWIASQKPNPNVTYFARMASSMPKSGYTCVTPADNT